jgi:steroid delta-isomerase-like uncharacterized protein
MSTKKNKAALSRFWNEVFNKRNLNLIDSMFTKDYVYHGPAGQEVRGTEGLKGFLKIYMDAFPDMQATVEDVFAEDDKVVSRTTCRGTHKGQLMAMPPTGKLVSITIICINRFVGDRIAEDWELFDMFGMMQQLGAIPKQ